MNQPSPKPSPRPAGGPKRCEVPTIVQIVAAPPGWVAVWRDSLGEVEFPIVCWALVEWQFPEGTVRDVVPMTPDGAGLELALEAEFEEVRRASGGGDAES